MNLRVLPRQRSRCLRGLLRDASVQTLPRPAERETRHHPLQPARPRLGRLERDHARIHARVVRRLLRWTSVQERDKVLRSPGDMRLAPTGAARGRGWFRRGRTSTTCLRLGRGDCLLHHLLVSVRPVHHIIQVHRLPALLNPCLLLGHPKLRRTRVRRLRILRPCDPPHTPCRRALPCDPVLVSWMRDV